MLLCVTYFVNCKQTHTKKTWKLLVFDWGNVKKNYVSLIPKIFFFHLPVLQQNKTKQISRTRKKVAEFHSENTMISVFTGNNGTLKGQGGFT